MLPKPVQFLLQKEKRARKNLLVAVTVSFLAVWAAPVARAQQQEQQPQRNDDGRNNSDLALQNLSHVAASAAEIKAILVKDAGLLVELKHLVAKDATDHGQIVSDSDLTDDAIYQRLETDVQFRSYATALVQRYGYLLPKMNPDSDVGKERQLLIEERTKWLAQNGGRVSRRASTRQPQLSERWTM